jgi:putative aldouronate transport system permease protein
MLHITLPSIRYTIVVLLILNIGGIMSTNFDQIYNLISPPVYGVGQTIDIYVYEQGVQGMNYSYSTAVGLFQQVIGFILLLLANYTSKLIGEDTFL